ncbi:GAF domain-containing protein [Sphingosinicella rhizophila]|uniref:histidine kinase n=1 Tax=Sphingosinicella rhizophila TaxID=3050082 RepID=A0ABU3QA54_9SPHN|nr:GAF domain-containing protein [Sphingosinicella sp. GR2756]MDT9600291.1 GAF domain-containing protein [Sphingosinicella sp. GR2756]
MPFLSGDGELASLIRSFDWARTPLGPIDRWPQSLKTATSIVVASPVPIVMLWGEQGVMIYNDAYSVFAGGRHPGLLGSNVRDGWPEVAAFNDNVMKVGLAGGTLSYADHELTLNRTGQPEQVFMNLDYSPVYDEAGRPAGVIAIVVETTAVRNARARTEVLVRLSDALRDLDDPGEIAFAASGILGTAMNASRVGYGTIEPDGETLRVDHPWGAAAIEPGPRVLRLRDYGSFVAGMQRGETIVVTDVREDERTRVAAEALERRDARSFVNVPVVEQGQLVAMLYVANAAPRRWAPDHLALIREVAERTRTAVERARSQTRLSRSEKLFRFLDALGKAIAKTADADEIMATTTRMVGEHLAVSICAYADMDADQDGFNIRGDWATSGSKSIVGHYRLADFGVLAVQKLTAGLPLIVGDVEAELSPEAAATFRSIGIAATICIPLVKEGRLTALMAIHDKAPRAWATDDLNLLREVTERSWAHVERVGAEAELRASAAALSLLNETLEQRVQERTGQLLAAEEALRQSQKMEAVGQLTGGLAHDFNNLLAGIGGSLEMIRMRIAQARPDAVERYLSAAQGAVKRAAALTHRLLAFSRRQTLDPRPTDINRLVADMEELVRRTMGPGIDVEVRDAKALWATLVDPNQLENAMLNLCINARDAMPDGGGLTIETSNISIKDDEARAIELPPGDYVALKVVDTGSGMSPEVAAKAFDPFFTTKPLGEGTGLGLSMIYGFARQSGGHVWIESISGEGTSVTILLPRHDAEIPAEGKDETRGPTFPAGDGEVVLVIDDEPTIRMLVGEVLAEAGYAAIEAADGPTGLQILKSDARIDLLITDVGLPGGLNGRQVADAARVARPDLKILFITGYAENQVVRNGRLDPGMSLITKPFQMEDLARKIKEAMEEEPQKC